MDRRDALKGTIAAGAGAVAWSSGSIRSVGMAPAAAASGPPITFVIVVNRVGSDWVVTSNGAPAGITVNSNWGSGNVDNAKVTANVLMGGSGFVITNITIVGNGNNPHTVTITVD